MIVDTSALAAVLFREKETETFLRVFATAPSLAISAASWVELTVVLARRGRSDVLAQAERLRANFDVSVAPVTGAQAEHARAACLEYGKGSGHPARLNFGDCFGYALAKDTGEPLLFKGMSLGTPISSRRSRTERVSTNEPKRASWVAPSPPELK